MAGGLARSAALVVAMLAIAAPASAQNTSEATLTRTFIASGDGTRLETNVYRPNGVPAGQRTPVILYVSPYLNTGGSGAAPPNPAGPAVSGNFPHDLAEAGLFRRGYTFVQVALRGTAGSEGCNDLGGRGEQADVKAAVEWAASRPWSGGRVGVWGHSYDGWTGIMALATKPRGLAAVVADAPVVSPYNAVFMNGNAYLPEGYFIEAVFQYNDLLPPAAASGTEPIQNAITGTATQPGCYVTKSAAFRNPDPTTAGWRERDLLPRAAGSATPVMMSFGFNDALVRPTQFPELWSSLTGPKRAWFGQWGHNAAAAPDPGSFWDPRLVGKGGFSRETLDFFDEHVAGKTPTGAPPVVVERSDGSWRADEAWPPADAAGAHIDLLPGTYRDSPGNSGTGQGPVAPHDGSRPVPSLTSGEGSWTLGRRTAHDVQLVGLPRISATVETILPGANLIALLYDVDAGGQATLISRGAYTLQRSGLVSFALHPQDWLLRAGHRLGVLLTGSDDSTFTPGKTGQDVGVTGGRLAFSLLCTPRPSNVDGGPSLAVSQRSTIAVPPAALAGRSAATPPPCT